MSNNKEDELAEILNENTNLNSQICQLNAKIYELKKTITNNEKKIWKLCEHNWERDYTVAFDDHIKHYCKKCLLWRNHYMYQ